jgi:CheY-like chemotaxis protein
VRAESDGSGTGARFFVSLPALEVESSELAETRDSALEPWEETGAPDANCLVMLVEDHADSARLLAMVMQRRGYRVVTAGSVAEALATFDREEVSVVVSDIGLPDGDGIALMELLRTRRPVPGIALSGYGMEHDHARSRAAGFVEHLTKPVDWPRLQAALGRLTALLPKRAPAVTPAG